MKDMDQIEEIRRKIDIVQLISEAVVLKKAGKNLRAFVPFMRKKRLRLWCLRKDRFLNVLVVRRVVMCLLGQTPFLSFCLFPRLTFSDKLST
ncbi:hypothetical protein A3D03_05280 [Candidatus Gottesmanbacteria bacterium RIFCSPHIGHO2_02_FULL_40_13]|uniref:Zinc finger CHC2-type domain-containing protein n=1 Tax=Candidatus Gottesmanbacteria bacterium RIFCSPHIGHO2_02_FULL_40_13 TaxID=1798384 RepID=A0A1F6A7K9_9BACT|nr:MAG: hypothetical protein A3D03_05280 [Candidatus Gottesmanbacteria bacterium RIFCSPHIGHO2_02_FULL_40_13]